MSIKAFISAFSKSISWIMIVLILLTVTLWIRSYFVADLFGYVADNKSTAIHRNALLTFNSGIIYFRFDSASYELIIPPTTRTATVSDLRYRKDLPTPLSYDSHNLFSILGFDFSYRSPHHTIMYAGRGPQPTEYSVDEIKLRFSFPFWLIILVISAFPLFTKLKSHFKKKLHTPGLCPTCGYDLRATPDRCPECGTVQDPSDHHPDDISSKS